MCVPKAKKADKSSVAVAKSEKKPSEIVKQPPPAPPPEKKEPKSAEKKEQKSAEKKEKEEKKEEKKEEEKKPEEKKEEEKEKSEIKKEEEKKEPSKKGEEKSALPTVAKCSEGSKNAVRQWVTRALDMGVQALRDEYRGLAKYTPEGVTYNAFKENHPAGRNRYQDVPCQDARRVVLNWPGQPTDYIHANYVRTPNSDNRFICAQGPLEGTCHEFWIMVVQEKVETIIMLCRLLEKGLIKCHQYWPESPGQTLTYGNIEITSKGVAPMTPEEVGVQITQLSLKWKNKEDKEETRDIRHFQWLDWPDRGVPPCNLTSMELLSRVRGNKQPILVHCSAGIGRTGTIVAIEYILEKMQVGQECAAMDVLLKEIRDQRSYTIQNDLQYIYIHRIMLCYFLEKHKAMNQDLLTPENEEKYKKFIEDYNTATGA